MSAPGTPSVEPPIVCARCASQMLPLQRFGVTIDQCTGCGAIFLDRGELEKLVQAEGNFYAAQAPAPAAPAAPPAPPAQPYPQAPAYGQPQYAAPPVYSEPRRPSFFGEIFGDHHERRRHH